ncbi:MAG: hypothetical protein MUF54_15345, partial [Polyangiaceae bacterium]|nr:hypothetical protein [Polyangiaceae bacterium]
MTIGRKPPDPDACDDNVTLEGLVERVTFENDTTGFRVVRLEVLGARHTVVGKMQRLAAGSRVRVSG